MGTVLLVDDSMAARVRARNALVEAGFTVMEAADGVEALEKLATASEVQLIVCDINMPRMSGVELIEELSRRKQAYPPFLMLTSEGRLDLIQRARELGARGWMFKPFDPHQLVASAKKIVESARSGLSGPVQAEHR